MKPRGGLIGGQIAGDAALRRGIAGDPALRRGLVRERPQRLASRVLAAPTWLFAYFFVEVACQIALLFPAFAGARIVFRSAAFVASLLGIVLLRASGEAHPARKVAVFAVWILGLSIFHPMTSSILVGIATTLLNLAIIAPLFWVPSVRIDASTVRRLLYAFWALQAASAAVGALQVYFPGSFVPATASVLSDESVGALQITLANGARIPRPMGLTDTPGGAGIGAAYCVVLAAGLLLDRPRLWLRAVLIAGMGIGCFTLYICQVRSMLVMALISLIAMGALLVAQGRFGRLATTAVLLASAAGVAFLFAVSIGGDAVTGRLSTLIEESPTTVYYSNRGFFLTYTFADLLPEYPLGAGLGRWGMMRTYFGSAFDMASPPIWAEIQWTGWLLDGGVPLMLVEAVCLLLALSESTRIALRKDLASQELGRFACMLAGYSVGAVAMSFNSCPFSSTLGVDFWLLNATLFAASRQLES